MVTTKQKSIADTQKIKRKELKHTIKESQTTKEENKIIRKKTWVLSIERIKEEWEGRKLRVRVWGSRHFSESDLEILTHFNRMDYLSSQGLSFIVFELEKLRNIYVLYEIEYVK